MPRLAVVAIVWGCLLTGLGSFELAAQPANDNFGPGNAVVLSGPSGSIDGDTIGATIEPGEHRYMTVGEQSVWYEWTATNFGLTTFEVNLPSSDAVVVVYTGTVLASLNPAPTVPFNQPLSSAYTFTAFPGTTYSIAVIGGWNPAFSGSFTLNWHQGVITNRFAGQFQFSFSDYFAGEFDSTSAPFGPPAPAIPFRSVDGAVITVLRVGGSAGRVSVDYRTMDEVGENLFVTEIADITSITNGPNTYTNFGTYTYYITNAYSRISNFTTFSYQTNWLSTNSGDFCGGMAGMTNCVVTNVYQNCSPDFIQLYGCPGGDYLNTSGTLVFEDFETIKKFVVPVFSDFFGSFGANGDKQVRLELFNQRLDPLELANPTDILPPLRTAAGSTATLNIREILPLALFAGSNTFEYFFIERTSYAVDEDAGTVTFDVIHPAGIGGNVVMRVFGSEQERLPWFPIAGSDYASSATNLYFEPIYTDGTRAFTSAQDFVRYETVLTFAQFETRKHVTINLFNDAEVEFNEDIYVDLVSIVNNPPAAGNFETWITILADDQPAGALDRQWNPDDVSYSTPRFNLAPGANNIVRALAVQADNRSVIGGDFTAFNSFPRNRIARINTDGSHDATFNPGTGADDFITSLVVYPITGSFNDNKIIVGGGFTSMNGIQRIGIARLNPDGSLDESFNPGTGVNGIVRSVALQSDGKVVIAGEFTAVNEVPRNNLARLNADGSVDASFDPGFGSDAIIWSVAVRDVAATIFVPRSAQGNEFEDRNEIETGSTQGTITVDYDYLLVPDNIRVYYDGVRIFDITTNGFGRHQIAYGPGSSTKVTIVLNEGTGEPGTLWAYTANIATPAPQRKIFIGGEFIQFNGAFAAGVARLNENGSLDTGYHTGAGVDGVVYTVAPQNDGRLVIGGFFSAVDFHPRNNIARLEFNGQVDLSYDSGSGPNDAVYSVAFQRDGKALVGGVFTSVNGTRRMGLTRLFVNGTVDTSFLDTAYNNFAGLINSYGFEPPNYVNSVALQSDEAVMIGGSFHQVGGNFAEELNNNTAPYLFGNQYFAWTRADKRVRYNVARLIGGYTIGPGNVGFVLDQNSTDEHSVTLTVPLLRYDGRLGSASATATTANNIAVNGSDFSSLPVNPLWPEDAFLDEPISVGYPGERFYPISITEDINVEGDEPFGLRLSNPVGSINLNGDIIPLGTALALQKAVGTVTDNDFHKGILAFSAATYFTNENSLTVGSPVISLPVIRTNGSSGSISVRYFTRDLGSAVAGVDYHATNGTLTFASGTTTQYVNVVLRDDFAVEPDEIFAVVITNVTDVASGARIYSDNPLGNPATNNVTAIATIIDNDLSSGRANFTSSGFSAGESVGNAQVTLRRLGGIVGQLSVSVAATSGTATAGSDFVATTNTITWVSGDSSPKTFSVSLLGDASPEGNETVSLRLFNPSPAGATGSVSTATLTIVEDDFPGDLTFGQPVYDIDERGTNASIIVLRGPGIAGTNSVDYLLVPSGSGTNFVPTTGTLIFAPGVTSASFDVGVLNNSDADDTNELTATLVLSNFSPSGSHGVITNAVLRIIDDEAIGDPAGLADPTFAARGGGTNAIYNLVLQPDGKLLVAGEFPTLDRRPRNRIGRLNDDGGLDQTFNALSGPNATVRALLVQPDGRVLIGGFFNSVTGTNRNHIARFLADGTLDRFFDPGSGADNPVYSMALLADDRILIGGAFVNVNGIPRPGVAIVETNGVVNLSFDPGTGADGTVFAVAVQLDGKILIGGEFSQVDDVPSPRVARLNADGSVDATFDVGTGPSGSVRAIVVQPDGRILIGGSFTNVNGTARGRLARLNADGSLDTAFLASVEGGDGDVLAVALQNDGRIVVGGDFRRFNGVTRNRITRLYRNGKTDPTINFGDGFNGFVSSLVIQPDRKIVVGGSFTTYDGQTRLGIVRLHGGSIAGPGGIEFQMPEFLALEDSTNATILVRRVGGTTGDVTVDYRTVDATALAGTHYQSTTGTLTFLEGETHGSFLVSLIDNGSIDGDLLAVLELIDTSYTGGAVPGPQPVATLRIVDDEGGLGFAESSYNVSENVPSLQAVITVRRSGSTNDTSTVDFATIGGGTATAFADYVPTNGTLVFPPGQTTRTFSVRILDDTFVDGNETVRLSLSSPSGGIDLGLASATLNIFDNEFSFGQFVFGSANYALVEDDGAVFVTIVRTNGTTGIATVSYQTRDGSAMAGLDYGSVSNVVAFADGETSKVIQVDVLDDLFVEDPETFSVRLLNPTGGATIGSVSNTVVLITENDISQIIGVSSSLDAESIVPANGIIDSNEVVTMSFFLRNVGTGDTSTNLIATLLPGNGVASPSGPQNYGPLIANGAAVSRQFSFRAVGSSGDQLVVTLQLTESGVTNGIVTFPFTIGGQASRNFTNSAGIVINDNTAATPYPSTINVANQGGTIISLAVVLNGFTHRYPDDVDILLVGPFGQRVTLLSDAGGSLPVAAPGISLTFLDSATNTPPDAGQLLSGNYHPVNYAAPGQNTADTFPLPAPRPTGADPFPYTNTAISVFNGTSPNGTWSLYVVDDAIDDAGGITNWSLRIQTSDPVVPVPASALSDLSLAAAAPSTVVAGASFQCSFTIRNHGPAAANDVALLGQLPSGLTVVSASASAGGWSKVQNTLTWTIGSLPSGAAATLTVVARATDPAVLTTTAAVSGNQTDPNTSNNGTTMQTTVNAVPALAVSQQGGSVRISWPSASGFKLQGADSLQPANWADVDVAPQVINGDNVVTVGIAGGSKFYRLRSP